VVETVMIFGLGFLLAALLALLVIPAVNARAERLAKRRMEALFPLSISELTAEKDHLRAELAVKERRLEQRMEEVLAGKHADMQELGRRAVRIEALEGDMALRDERIRALEADLAATSGRLQATEGELAATRGTLAGARETLSALEEAHRRTLDELATTRAELDRTGVTLNETRTLLEATVERLTTREGDLADLTARHEAALQEIDARRITISDLETRISTQTSRGDEFERQLLERRAELAGERQRLAEIARSLVAEQERTVALEGRLRALEGGPAGAGEAAILAENAELRRRIDEVTDAIMAAKGTAPAAAHG
jgi:chromosome segregation ATPase